MAKVTITFEDSPTGTTVRVSFDPVLKKGVELTDAQELAMWTAQSLADRPDRESVSVTGTKDGKKTTLTQT